MGPPATLLQYPAIRHPARKRERLTMSAYRARKSLLPFCRPLLAGAVTALLVASPAAATDLLYILRSPSFGGDNTGALAGAQIGQNLKNQHDAALAAAARASSSGG